MTLFEEVIEFLGWDPCQRKFINGSVHSLSPLLVHSSCLVCSVKDVSIQLPNPAAMSAPPLQTVPSGTGIQNKLFHKLVFGPGVVLQQQRSNTAF